MTFFRAFIAVLLLTSCVTLDTELGPSPEPDAAREKPPVSRKVTESSVDTRTLPEKRQNELAFEAFKGMLEVPEGLDRVGTTQHFIDAYEGIVRDYPLSGLAQEGSWKIVRMYLREFDPPKLAEAEEAYRRFARKYPDSFLLDDALTELLRYYGNRAQWNQVVIHTAPIVQREMIEAPPMILVYYGEGNYHLGRKDEAVLAFSLAIKRTPASSFLYKKSVERLKELDPSKVPPAWAATRPGIGQRGRTLAGRTLGGQTVVPIPPIAPPDRPGIRTTPRHIPQAGSSPASVPQAAPSKPPSAKPGPPPPLPGRTVAGGTAGR